MVERCNGRIEEVLQSHHFRSGEELETTLHRYVVLCNQQLPQSALGSRTPLQAADEGIRNVSMICQHITIIPTLRALLADPFTMIDGFIGPGHVSMVIGNGGYGFIARDYAKPLVVAGFEPLDMLQALLMVLEQMADGRAAVENQYARVVPENGNVAAMRAIAEVCEERESSDGRGLGTIDRSGVRIRAAYADLDAERRFGLVPAVVADPAICDCRPLGALTGALLAGYGANVLVPVGISPLVRSWLVARLEALKMATVPSTTIIARFVDGVVFALFAGFVALAGHIPQVQGNVARGLAVAGAINLALFGGLPVAMFRFRSVLSGDASAFSRIADRVAAWLRADGPALRRSLCDGVVRPRRVARQLAAVVGTVVTKLIAASHFLWGGLAIGIVLSPFASLFLMVFAGFAIILSRFIRVPGGFVVGSAFALGLLGVPDELALLMILFSNITSMVIVLGWWPAGAADQRRQPQTEPFICDGHGRTGIVKMRAACLSQGRGRQESGVGDDGGGMHVVGPRADVDLPFSYS